MPDSTITAARKLLEGRLSEIERETTSIRTALDSLDGSKPRRRRRRRRGAAKPGPKSSTRRKSPKTPAPATDSETPAAD